jgi:hypothetical protein
MVDRTHWVNYSDGCWYITQYGYRINVFGGVTGYDWEVEHPRERFEGTWDIDHLTYIKASGTSYEYLEEAMRDSLIACERIAKESGDAKDTL